MPKTRYIETYHYPANLPASEKTVANAKANGWIERVAYQVSDEELEREAKVLAEQETLVELAAEKKTKILKRLKEGK